MQSNFSCGNSNTINNRFNNGDVANSGQFPFHVAIFRNDLYSCGGSIISENFVITACHCVVEKMSRRVSEDELKLLFGSIDLQMLNGNEIVREAEKTFPHPDYQVDKILKQDIALIKVRGDLQFSSSILPICLDKSQTSISNYMLEKFIVLGFGSSENIPRPSRYLNYGKMSIISRQDCIESNLIFGLLPEKSAFCAKSINRMTVCSGDSGGGFVTTNNNKFYLYGISSVSITDAIGTCNPENSVAFTKINFFIDWIVNITNINY